MADDLTLLRQQLRQLADRWQDFRTARREWDDHIRRRATQVLVPSFDSKNAPVDVQSPDLEGALHSFVAILNRVQTRIDAVSLDDLSSAKDDVEEIRIHAAMSYGQQDDGRKLARALKEAQTRYGVGVVFKHWQQPPEPDTEDLAPYEVGGSQHQNEDAADYQRRVRDEKRKQFYEEYYQQNQVFWWESIDPLTVAWWPLNKPELFVQDSEIPYVEARELKNSQGLRLMLDKEQNLAFTGEAEPAGEYAYLETSADSMPKLHFIRRAMLDKKTKRWKLTLYVTKSSSEEASVSEQDAAVLEERDVPFERSPYFIVPSGGELTTEHDPHLRYRPHHLYPLIVDVQEQNALVSLLVQIGVDRIRNPFYVPVGKLTEHGLAFLTDMAEQGYGVYEGTGAARRFRFRIADASPGEAPMAPELLPIPSGIEPHLLLRLEQIQLQIDKHSPNRFQTGEAGEIAQESTGAAFLNQAEASGLDLNDDLTNYDHFVEDWLNAELEAIKHWDDGTPDGAFIPFVGRIRGDEPFSREPAEVGRETVLTARHLKRHYRLIAQTERKTRGEQAFEADLADRAREKGRLSKERWLKDTGADDPKKAEEQLWADKVDEMTEMRLLPFYARSIATLIAAFVGMAPPPEMTAPMGAPAGPGMQANGQTPSPLRPSITAPPVPGPASANGV